MALYWPDKKVALDIVDDPFAEHVDESQLKGWKVLKITCDDASSPERMRRVGDTLCALMGVDPPAKTPEWLAANDRLFHLLAS